MPFLSPNQVSKHWREKYHIPWTCLPQAHLGVFRLCLSPLIAPDYLGGRFPCLSSALWCQYPTSMLSFAPIEYVGKGSDHLQLIKFWPSCGPEKGVCGGAKICGSTLLQPARSVCVSSERFFHLKWKAKNDCNNVTSAITQLLSQ